MQVVREQKNTKGRMFLFIGILAVLGIAIMLLP